ncbi:sensor histidine kinase [Nocardioides sp. MH1]|uniref:sensor histidine kinase n=1 Tax=Nocardioides sp. MH1 TaxID=3242490 RepID=UPI0035201C65
MDDSQVACQPALRWHGHAWRFVACVLIGALAWSPVADAQADHHPYLFWADALVGIVCFVLAAYRRRWPLTIAVVTTLLTPLTSVGAGATLLATVSLATRRRWWQIVMVGVLNLVMTALYYRIQPAPDSDPWWLAIGIGLAFIATASAWGMFIGSRRELIWTLRQRAETAEAERDLRSAQARSTERERIAREMHDVLAHRISQISMHAGALTFRDDLTADEMRASVGVIQEKAHEALTDLRGVLGVLRDSTGAPLTGPQPTYDDVGSLVADLRAHGTRVELEEDLPAPVPDAVGRTVYRIVQEGTTNARKHAPAAVVTVRLAGEPAAGLLVEIRNGLAFGPSHTPGAGLGLVGLAERAALAGGRLTHRIEGSTFVLRAWLPWAA